METLEEIESKITSNNTNIAIITKEIDELMLDEKVKRYVELEKELDKLINENDKYSMKRQLVKQIMCNHKLVCFKSVYFKRLKFSPSFVCLNCGRELNGYLSDEQVCINENYIYEDRIGIFSNKEKIEEIKNRFISLKAEGFSIEKIEQELKEEYMNEDINQDIKVKIKKQ